MFSVDVMGQQHSFLISFLHQQNNFVHAICVRWHVGVVLELIVRNFGAKQIELIVNAELGEFHQLIVIEYCAL